MYLYSAVFMAKQKNHGAFQNPKKLHWEGFLDKLENIWETYYYINKSFNQANFAQILALQTSVPGKATSNLKIT